MQIAYLLLIAPILLSGGCAGMIAGCGRDLTPLKTKEEVHAQLGAPSASGVADGNFFEEFRTRRKIAESNLSLGADLAGWDNPSISWMKPRTRSNGSGLAPCRRMRGAGSACTICKS